MILIVAVGMVIYIYIQCCDVEKVHAVVARSTFPSQNVQSTPLSDSDVEKVHAVVARSTCRSQNVQDTPWSDHFGKLRCQKSARRCGAKHISKSKCTKHTMVGPLLEVAMSKKCTPLWREAHFQVKMYKAHHCRTTSGSCDVKKAHAVVARSTFPSQNVQSTPGSDHFWKLRCQKSARRCGAKHISKSKRTKHHMFAPLLEVRMSKKHAVVARSTFPSQNVQSTPGSDHFWKFRCRKSARRCGAKHISKSKRTKHHMFAPLLEVRMSKKHAVVARSTFRSQNAKNTRGSDHFWRFRCRFASLHYTTLHYRTLHSTTLHYTTLHYTTLHYTTLPSTTLHYITLHSTTLHYKYNYNYTTTLHYTTLNYTTLRYITLHSTPLRYITLHYTPQHYN